MLVCVVLMSNDKFLGAWPTPLHHNYMGYNIWDIRPENLVCIEFYLLQMTPPPTPTSPDLPLLPLQPTENWRPKFSLVVVKGINLQLQLVSLEHCKQQSSNSLCLSFQSIMKSQPNDYLLITACVNCECYMVHGLQVLCQLAPLKHSNSL